MPMFENLLKKMGVTVEHEEEIPTLDVSYQRVPMTIALKQRQYEERIRGKYNLPKEKTGTIL